MKLFKPRWVVRICIHKNPDKSDMDDIAVCEADACQYYDGYGDGLDRAIEIVKRGGRDEE